jgi:hypothetical protein
VLWWWLIGISLMIIYYCTIFGIEPLSENLFGNYTRRIEQTYLGKIRTNAPLFPDKFVTLLSLGGFFIQVLLTLLKINHIASNFFTRILFVISVLALLPLSIYVLAYTSLLIGLIILWFGLKEIFNWIVKGSGKQ